MAQTPLKHIVFIAGQSMSHIGPALHLCARLVARFPQSFVSFYVSCHFAYDARQYLMTRDPSTRHRIRVTSSTVDVGPEDPAGVILAMERNFGTWIAEQLRSTTTEIDDLTVAAPSRIIEDHVNGGIGIANMDKHNLPIVCWCVGSAISFLTSFGENEGGSGSKLYEAMATRLEQRPNESLGGIRRKPGNRLISGSGFPAYYEHEHITQDIGILSSLIGRLHKRWKHMLEHTDTMVFVSVYEMEPITVEACASAFPKPVMALCPGLGIDLPRPNPEADLNTSDSVMAFMNRAYTELGPHSIVYISFGSLVFPPLESVEHVKILVDEIIAAGFRVVFSVRPSHIETTDLDDRYLKTGQAIFPGWVRQLDVLEHPALHYFVTHGGWNSISEAIVRGVPMIFWPFMGDQPMNTIHMTRQHDCGFELFQVRTGPAKSVAYTDRGDIEIVGSADADANQGRAGSSATTERERACKGSDEGDEG